MQFSHLVFLLMASYIFAFTACGQQDQQRASDLRRALMTQSSLGEYENAIKIADKLLEMNPESIGDYVSRGELNYMVGEMQAAVDDFDKAIELEPAARPQLWQRGLALYYLDRFEDGAEQFVVHRTVNGQDVENAVWHFACLSRQETPEVALENLIPIQRDTRVPMMELHKLFAGKMKAEEVVAAATGEQFQGEELARNKFYAHFYIGLYYEAIGEKEKSMEHMKLSNAGENYMPKQALMSQVAKVHLQMRGESTER